MVLSTAAEGDFALVTTGAGQQNVILKGRTDLRKAHRLPAKDEGANEGTDEL